MKKIFTLTLIFGCLTFVSFGQEKEITSQKPNEHIDRDKSAKADVLSVQTEAITPPNMKMDRKIERRENRISRRHQRLTRHRRLTHRFNRGHSLIKRR